MKLTSQQRDYMRGRLASLALKRIEAEVREKIGSEPSIPELSFTDKCDLIRSGKAKLKAQDKISSYTDLIDAYDYPQQEIVKAKKALDTFNFKKQVIEKRINQEKQNVFDVVMLGESADALEAIRNFEKGVL